MPVRLYPAPVDLDFGEEYGDDNDPLCCCEYYNKDNERFHLLGCCCNCIECDSVFTSIFCCQRTDSTQAKGMLITFQDRLRIPWRGGAKQITLDAVIPLLAIPIIIGISASSFYAAIFMGTATVATLGYGYYFISKSQQRTRFFYMWTFWSIAYLVFFFEMTVPLMELLPEENFILVILTCTSVFFMFKTKQKATANSVVRSTHEDDVLPDIAEEQTAILLDHDETDEHSSSHSNICQTCRKYVQPRTFHCTVCQGCVLRMDHHSYWLDCCIGQHNHCYYICGLWFSLLALLLCANLTLTSVCHPFLVFRLFGIHVLLPDDCSEIFDQYEMSLAFIISVYALVISVYVIIALVRQIYLISKGLTVAECRRGQSGNRRSIMGNWKVFLCWSK